MCSSLFFASIDANVLKNKRDLEKFFSIFQHATAIFFGHVTNERVFSLKGQTLHFFVILHSGISFSHY